MAAQQIHRVDRQRDMFAFAPLLQQPLQCRTAGLQAADVLAGHADPDHLDGVRRRESTDRVVESAQVRERGVDRIAETAHQQRQRLRGARSQSRDGSFEGFPEFRSGAEEADPRQRVQALLKDVVRCVRLAQSGVDGLDQQTVRGVDVPMPLSRRWCAAASVVSEVASASWVGRHASRSRGTSSRFPVASVPR